MYKDLDKNHTNYVDLSYLTETEKAYWAGLLDGEGSLQIAQGKTPVISLAMTCEKTLNSFKEIFDLGTVLTRSRNKMLDHWKDCYCLKTTTHKAAKICEALLPYFITKQEIAKEISEFYVIPCEVCNLSFWSFNNKHTCSDTCTEIRKRNKSRDWRKEKKGN